MSAVLTSFPTDAVPIAAELNRTGFVKIENVIAPEWIESMRAYIRSLLSAEGERYFSLVRPGDAPGTPADAMVHAPEVRGLLVDLARQARPGAADNGDDVYDVLRIIAGPKGESGSLNFHYDASIITALVPIFMPSDGMLKSGELVTFPNRRPFRRSVVQNIVEKAVVQNGLYRKAAVRRFESDPSEFVQILEPGSLYLFWGYRTYHGNLPCRPNTLRATMLMHYGDPHGGDLALGAIRSGRRLFEYARRQLT